MLDQEIVDRDRRRAALHEAAHAVLANRFGGGGRAYIWPTPGGGSHDVRSWSGTCEIWSLPGSIKPSPSWPDVIEAPLKALALTALAGVAAEIYDELRDEDAASCELQSFLEVEELSATDTLMLGGEEAALLVGDVISHIAFCWPEIEKLAAQLERFPERGRPSDLA